MTTRISIIGAGKLGTPVSVALASQFPVLLYDKDPETLKLRQYPHMETGPDGKEPFQPYFEKAVADSIQSNFLYGLTFADNLQQAIWNSDIIFVAVQTPHHKNYDGSVRLPADRRDFDYSYLVDACWEISRHVKKEQTVGIISTVLPGTIRREILPFFKGKCNLCYTPQFIAMGTVVQNFMYPEFILIGADTKSDCYELENFYRSFYDKIPARSLFEKVPQVCSMTLESAELTKVAYNLHISAKIGLANTIGEFSHKIPHCNVDDVTNTLNLATNRLISRAYTKAGNSDGGNCLDGSTEILMWDGSTETIGNLSLHASEFRVKAFDLNKITGDPIVKGTARDCKMTRLNADLIRVYFDNDKNVRCTPDHQFLMDNGYYLDAGYLRKGMMVMGVARKKVMVSNIEYAGSDNVYNFEVDNYYNYALGAGVFVHNCHPRDAIAMSWLGNKLNVSFNPFEAFMKGREKHVEWFASVLLQHAGRYPYGGIIKERDQLPIVILGKAFKAETNIVTGSPAILLANILKERSIEFDHYDPYVDPPKSLKWVDFVRGSGPKVFFVAVKHEIFKEYEFSRGSVVVDPWRYMPDAEGVKIVRIGVGE